MQQRTQPLEIRQGADQVHVVDQRGNLISSFPTPAEARAFAAGYRTGRNDAAAIVREQAAVLSEVGRS